MLRFVLTNVLATNKAEMAICTRQQDILNYFSDVYIVQIGTEDKSAYEHVFVYIDHFMCIPLFRKQNKIIIISNDKMCA